MNPKFWKAIDLIGSRKASRFEWESLSGMSWPELFPYLAAVGGRALDGPDPDDPAERMVLFETGDGRAWFDSPHLPAHRNPIAVVSEQLALYGLNVTKVAQALAKRYAFSPVPGTGKGPFLNMGYIQKPNQPCIEVILYLPSTDLYQDLRVLESCHDGQLLLVPHARWLGRLSVSVDRRDLSVASEDETLVNVLREHRLKRTKTVGQPIIEIRPDDRWRDAMISFDASTSSIKVSIGNRKGVKKLLGEGNQSKGFAEILMRILAAYDHRWTNTADSISKQGRIRKAFERFESKLRNWIPINDGKPFDRHPDHSFTPRFQCKPFRSRRMCPD